MAPDRPEGRSLRGPGLQVLHRETAVLTHSPRSFPVLLLTDLQETVCPCINAGAQRSIHRTWTSETVPKTAETRRVLVDLLNSSRSKDATFGALGLTTRSKGIAMSNNKQIELRFAEHPHHQGLDWRNTIAAAAQSRPSQGSRPGLLWRIHPGVQHCKHVYKPFHASK